MTVSSIPCCKKINPMGLGEGGFKLQPFMMLLVLLLFGTMAQAEGIQIKSFSLSAVDHHYEMSVNSEIVLNATLEQALEKGIVLYFVTKFSLVDSRWYWLNDEVVRGKLKIGLRYYALTRQYHLNFPELSQSFNTLNEALQALGQLRKYSLTVKSDLKQDIEYIASLRIWLDLTRMPKPFQVEALGSSEWNLSSDRLEWRMKLPTPEQPFQLKGR
ncbi:MAG: DUF4390 domain-containing protein [Nitrosomonas sp.]